ncbi:hypothetical protein P175DRAFT_0535590 [Aspergillus ochraceoroseus IBT 24754]|uniref:Uncharacterized protein n=1 Tax=Aspergillus ochraceoroseus IBT 24754 TaxID=1392256 RepID=A0A2T5LNI6_9EURO|nr:uncharacterized protein P175DRAFT_0535590 [Aspergillus ochraceoroseus IBT 24754]PTU17848.1 hypothetical protein P175DRAFT_0535590 [Aspergillus ochraceoroseus IBT 24754]
MPGPDSDPDVLMDFDARGSELERERECNRPAYRPSSPPRLFPFLHLRLRRSSIYHVPDGTIYLKYAGDGHFVEAVYHYYALLQRREIAQQYLEFSGVTSSQFETLSDRNCPGSTTATFVVEIGTSESASRLAIDARGWLETPGATVRTALTISLNYNNDDDLITIEVWKVDDRNSAISTGNMPLSAFRILLMDILRAPGATVPTSSGRLMDPVTQAVTPTDEVRLDFDIFVGRQAAGIMEGDVILTRLIQFAKDFWEPRNGNSRTKARTSTEYTSGVSTAEFCFLIAITTLPLAVLAT